jgi:xanthine dehydrogenase accessory factor
VTDIFAEIVALKREGRAAVLVTVVATSGHVPTQLASKMLVGAQGLLAGTVGGGMVELRAIADAREVLSSRKPLSREYVLDGDVPAVVGVEQLPMLCGGRLTLFFEPLGAAAQVYLFGAGHVGRALCQALLPLDFAVTFVDYRPEQLVDLPAAHLTAGDDYASLPELAGLAEAYVVIATHSHTCDERVLEQILVGGVRPRYLGVVASRRKRTQMLAGLRERLGDVDLEGLFMPVGLHLGGNSPAAVALSIAAEIQAFHHDIGGHAHMRDRGESSR